MTAGTFTLIKNESPWIVAHLLSWLPWVDEMVFFDGNSTDGTIELIKDVRKNHPFGKRITLVEDRDCRDLDTHYVQVFNECLHTLKTDYAIFAHPDMILDDAGDIGNLGKYHSYFTNLRSFAGEPGGQLFEILGRGEKWRNIMRLRKPDLGLHYWGAYGAVHEGMFFSKITGNVHKIPWSQDPENPGELMDRNAFKVEDSGIRILHYSDVRPIERRIDRMRKCLLAQEYTTNAVEAIAAVHPRVTFKDGYGLTFKPAEYHPLLREAARA